MTFLLQMGCVHLASFLLLTLLFKCLASQQPNTDGFFLAAFLQQMGAKIPLSQDSSSSICSWSGVSCDSMRENVVSFAASGLGLAGPIPDNTIGKLNKLEVLDLSVNNITKLSSDIWGLGSSLKFLNLSTNLIHDSLLNNIGNFGNLESLDLSRNSFFGEIPQGISSMANLRFLNLSRNSFEGSIPEGINGCKRLLALDLSVNKLNGSFPDGFGTRFKNLSFVDLAGNQIRGTMPDLSGFESVTHLNVSGNLLQGSITGLFHGALSILDLSNNNFSQIKVDSGSNLSSLIYLDVSSNHVNVDSLSNFDQESSSLKHLNLANNRFPNQKFPQIGGLHSLEYLNLSGTTLTGRIPPKISQLTGLRTLDLSDNELSGKVPDFSTANLTILDLSSNNFTGEIPSFLIEKLPQMKSFNFSDNNLTFCAKKLSLQRFNSSFIGSQNSCPLAANPDVIPYIKTKTSKLKLALLVSLSALCVLLGIICFFFTCRRSTRSRALKHSYKEEQNAAGPYSFRTDSTAWVADVRSATLVPVIMFEKPLLSFTFADLLSATGNFDRGTLLSEGSFGPVYRGFLPGGIQVAMKVLIQISALVDEDIARELERLGRIKHQNLVPLIGYCLAGDQRIAIYEYMENGNLQNLLHDLPLGVQATDDWSHDTWDNEANAIQNITNEGFTTWRFRCRIALGVARALAFLHHGCFPQVVHGDVTASNVYLDSFLEPKLSYFGLEKILATGLNDEKASGSSGYTPPELECDAENASSSSSASTVSPKNDVFCFGVVLFELVTGKKPLHDGSPKEKKRSLVEWARPLVKKKQYSTAIDPKIRDSGSEKQMEEALRIAYLCTAELPSKRPSMQQIVGLLKDMEAVARD